MDEGEVELVVIVVVVVVDDGGGVVVVAVVGGGGGWGDLGVLGDGGEVLVGRNVPTHLFDFGSDVDPDSYPKPLDCKSFDIRCVLALLPSSNERIQDAEWPDSSAATKQGVQKPVRS